MAVCLFFSNFVPDMAENKVFLRQDNDYRTMKAFRKAECIYDVTYYFAHTFLKPGDRTIDQMVQAARSGKQNLAEGTIDGVTSFTFTTSTTQFTHLNSTLSTTYYDNDTWTLTKKLLY